MQTFTKENFDNLISTCEKIISISKENIDGALMATQLQFLGEDIKEFAENPIVANSGMINSILKLPSDKDIELFAKNKRLKDWHVELGNGASEYARGLVYGAKWMKEQITGNTLKLNL